MAETRLQARKRVSDPLCQTARPGPQLLAKTLGSYARSGNVAIVQSLIPCGHMSELPHPIVVDCTITLSAAQACQPLVSTTGDLVPRAAVRRPALHHVQCSCVCTVAESTHHPRQPLLTHRHRSGPATPPETRRQEFQSHWPMPERRCTRFAWTRAQTCEWRGWDALFPRARAHARWGVRVCTDSAWAPPALKGQIGTTRQRQTQQTAFLCAVSPASPPATPDAPASTRASRPSRNPSSGAPSLRPMPEGHRMCPATTPIVVCGSVRTEHGPHRPIKDSPA